MEFINYMRDIFSYDYARDEGKKISEEPLIHDEAFHLAYVNWLMTNEPYKLVEEIYRAQLQDHKTVEERDACITFLTVPTINGFTMHYDASRWEQCALQYFFEYLAHILVEQQGYEIVCKIRERVQYKDRHEVVERYKLHTKEKVDYSDIMLRLCYTNGAITSLKFCAVRTKRRIAHFPALIRSFAS